MKLVLGVYDYPPHSYHYKYIDASWVLSDIYPRHPTIKKVDATNIPYKDLEAIYASHVLEHIKDPLKTLKHWYDVLAPGGYVHINVPDIEWALDQLMKINAGEKTDSPYFNTRERVMQIFNGTMDDKYDVHYEWFSEEKLFNCMWNAGFDPLDGIEIEKEYEAHDMMCLIAKGYKYANGND